MLIQANKNMLRHTPSIEPMTGFEPVTSSFQGSALPLSYIGNFKKRAGNGTQTRDPQLGRLMLYRLSYSRKKIRGRRWIRTTEVVRQQIYSLPHLATLVFALEPAFRKLRILLAGAYPSGPCPQHPAAPYAGSPAGSVVFSTAKRVQI